ncbi:MAG: hypothetical protein WC748_02325 [Legionellales bacterium]|jgi:photosystem II stability/assembly factor-like uncharacterized protein
MSYLRPGITLFILFFAGLGIALEKNAGDLFFEIIPEITDVTTSACFKPVLATYTIISGTPVPLTLQDIKILNHDHLPDNAVTVVSSASNSCVKGQQLAFDETCNITVSLQPCEAGNIDRELIIYINTTQGALTSSIATGIEKIFLQVSGGTGANNSPLLIQSQDNGVTWENFTSIVQNIPNAVTISNSACNLDQTCIIGGFQTSGSSPALLITTLNSGNDWAVVGKVLDGNQLVDLPAPGRFNGSSCSGDNCIAAGIDLSNDSPLLVSSIDAGASWHKRTITGGPGQAELLGASCNNNLCIVIGTDYTTSSSPPLLASSSDGGVTWTQITTLADDEPFPAGAQFRQTEPSCSDKICITGGSIVDDSGGPDSKFFSVVPFLISSVTVGTWEQVVIDFPEGDLGSFNAFSCSESNCVAVGSNDSTGTALIFYTQDAGTNWIQVTHLGDDEDPSSLPGGLDHVSCSNNNCIAGQEGNDHLLLSSTDGGKTWYQITTATGEGGFPSYGGFYATGCSGTICMAAGGNISNPAYLLTSLDGGSTWDNVSSTIGDDGLPAGGVLNTVSISR